MTQGKQPPGLVAVIFRDQLRDQKIHRAWLIRGGFNIDTDCLIKPCAQFGGRGQNLTQMIIGQRDHPAINIITEFKAMHSPRRHGDQLTRLHGEMLIVKGDVGVPMRNIKQLKQVGVPMRLDVPVMQA